MSFDEQDRPTNREKIIRAGTDFVEDFFADYYRFYDEQMRYKGFDHDRENFKAEEISINAAGLNHIGEHSSARVLFPCRIRIPSVPISEKNKIDVTHFLRTLNLIEGESDYISEYEDDEGQRFWEFDAMVKEQVYDPKVEKEGYDVLRSLGIQTLVHLFPLDSDFGGGLENRIRNASYTLTYIEKYLRPLSGMGLNELFIEHEGESVISEVFDILATLHENGVIHGDPQFKNWGYKPSKGVFLFDPELLINFRNINFYWRKNKAGMYNGGLGKYTELIDDKRDGLDKQGKIPLLWDKALIDDIYLLLSGFIDKHRKINLDDHHREQLLNDAAKYITRVRKSGRMSDELMERVVEEFKEFVDIDQLRERLLT